MPSPTLFQQPEEIPWDKKEQRDEFDESRDVGGVGQEG